MDYDMKKKLIKIFTPKSIKVPVLYDTYCNPTDIPWEMWRGKIDDLLLKKRLHIYETTSGERDDNYSSLKSTKVNGVPIDSDKY